MTGGAGIDGTLRCLRHERRDVRSRLRELQVQGATLGRGVVDDMHLGNAFWMAFFAEYQRLVEELERLSTLLMFWQSQQSQQIQ
jgi:hypothetical protein